MCLRGPKKSAVRRMRRRKKEKQRKDSNVEKRHQRNVPSKKTRINGKRMKIFRYDFMRENGGKKFTKYKPT